MNAMTKGCLAGTGVCFISHEGEVFPCGYLPAIAGDLRKQSFAEIWNDSAVFGQLRDDDNLKGKCGCCEFRHVCMGCRARAYAATGDFLAEEPFCVSGRTAALDVTENDGAGFETGALLDLAGEDLADSTQAKMAEFVAADILQNGGTALHVSAAGKLGAFGGNHDAEITATGVALANQLGDLIDVEGDFGDEDDVGAATDAAVSGDPAGVTAHDFDDDDAVVRFGSGMDAVNGAGGDVDGGVESKGEIGAGEIVVDGFGNTDDFDAIGVEFLRDGERVIAADGDEGVAVVAGQVFHAAFEAAVVLGRIGARGAENGAAAGQNAAYSAEAQFGSLVLEQTAPAFHEAHKLVAIMKGSLAHDRPYDSVEAGAIASAS
jgi:radical SAM protein with 4Fe4S-binding SPASM domain